MVMRVATRQSNPVRYGEVEQLSEDILKRLRSHLEKKSWSREARMDALNALAWTVAFVCHGSSDLNPFDLYNWFDDALWRSINDAERLSKL